MPPTYPLELIGKQREDFEAGPLVDWIEGSLRFDGSGYARLTNEEIVRPFRYRVPSVRGEGEWRTAEGRALKSPQVFESSLIVEVYARVDAGHTGGVLLEKLQDAAGYSVTIDEEGRAVFRVVGAGQTAEASSKRPLGDGAWHHLLCELDRDRERLSLYLDGELHAESVRFLFGGVPREFRRPPRGRRSRRPRVARDHRLRAHRAGSLSDARTTIEELYAWQFDGPFLRDFAGRAPTGAGRDAGAVERVE